MSTFALYRLPYADSCYRVEQTQGSPLRLHSCEQLNGCQGFVVAPFQVTESEPILLIRPDRLERLPLQKCEDAEGVTEDMVSDPCSYADCFGQIECLLRAGVLRKVVLARSASLPRRQAVSPEQLFWRACENYPRMFISLVSMPDGSYWLTATPEILLEGQGGEWRTIALAGTMQLEGDELEGEGESMRWSTKNIQEQRYVATYIANCLEQFSLPYKEEGPRTVRAAHLVHLRSDFTFSSLNPAQIGDLLQALHPTPAVCGLPKQEAFRFITQHEHAERQYYSGFMGPLRLPTLADDGEATHLYVSLRCMHIGHGEYRLYAGGGILPDSQLEQEWQETEAKMQTMRQLLSPLT